MDTPIYGIEALNKKHEKKNFSCGLETLDRYLTQQAGQDARRRVTATYVLTENSSEIITGYYTLSSTSIGLGALPKEIIKKLPRYPTLPATLLGRLAIDRKIQGKRFGEQLLIDALKRSLELSNKVASMAVVVDAKNNGAIRFYKHYGFTQFPESQNRLFLPMDTIVQLWDD